MTRRAFVTRAGPAISALAIVDASRAQGRVYVGEHLIPNMLLYMIVDLDFDWYWFLKAGRTEPDNYGGRK